MAHPVDDELHKVATAAIRTLVPVLPIIGSPKRGYQVAECEHRLWSREEVRAAAKAVCELHRALGGGRGSDSDRDLP